MSKHRTRRLAALGGAAALGVTALAATAGAATPARYGPGPMAHATDRFIATTIDPVTGDLNPYGVAVVPVTAGTLVKGDVLVGDFGHFSNSNGAGNSIVEITPSTGAVSDFAHGAVLDGTDSMSFNPKGFLWTGDLGPLGAAGNPTGADGNVAILSTSGTPVATFDKATTGHGFFAGTWGMEYGSNSAGKVSFYWPDAGTAADAGTVWRLDPNPTATTSNGQPTNATYQLLSTLPAGGPNASVPTVTGPQGEAYDAATDTLYVADDANNTIYAIPHASTATNSVTPRVVLRGGPLDAPDGIVFDAVANKLFAVDGAGANRLIELTTAGRVLGVRNLAPSEPAGALFGLTLDPSATTARHAGLYYVNDDENSLHLITVPTPKEGRADPMGAPSAAPGTGH